MWAPRSNASTLAATPPAARSASLGPVRAPDEPLPRHAHDHRAAEGHDLVQAPQQLEVVLERLAEADAGVEPDPLLGDAVARPRSQAAPRGRPSPRTRRPRSAGRPAWSAARRACASGTDRLRTRPPPPPSPGSPRSAVTSLTSTAPASVAARATAALEVSIESGTDRRRRAARSPASRGAAPRRPAPARRRGASTRRRRRRGPPLGRHPLRMRNRRVRIEERARRPRTSRA